jgi:transcriptional repressor NrdR
VLCPFCQDSEHRVVESRVPEAKDAIRRRRECHSCGRRFTTYERIEEAPLVVIKRSGEREGFDRLKLLDGFLRACHKRRVTTGLLEVAVRDIESELRNRLRGEVRTAVIGELALRRLKDIDQVAYVRFASVYRQFEDVEEFGEELARLEREPPLSNGQTPLDETLFAGLDSPSDKPRNRRHLLRAVDGGRTLETVPPTSQETHDGD